MFTLAAISFGVLTVSLPNPYFSTPPIPSNHVSIGINMCVSAFLQGSADPFFYELLAEVTYPLSEGISAGILVTIFNAATMAMLFVASWQGAAHAQVFVTYSLWQASYVVFAVDPI